MDLLTNTIQPYAWGSRNALAALQNRPQPSPGPEAELWMGAHPSAPSRITRSGSTLTLDTAIAADPERELGRACRERFGDRLPFLLKILAADKALSIQVHPNRTQAQQGYAAQAGKAIQDRSYADDWPKPEILCALTRFEALAGLRTAEDAASILANLEVAALEPMIEALRSSPDSHGLRRALQMVLTWPEDERRDLIATVVSAAERIARAEGPYACAYGLVPRIANDYPHDMGVLASLLLRHTILEPGQALYLAPGGLHAYIHGVGVELLASSDNVLRAGLTRKRIDVPELLMVTDPAIEVPVLRDTRRGDHDGAATYETPTPEFRLHRVRLDSQEHELSHPGPRIVLCTAGSLELRGPDACALQLNQGESAFLADVDGPVTAQGQAEIFVAAVGCVSEHADG